MVDFMDRDDQEMVRFYHEMAEKAARHHLTLTLHGAYKPTGMERTWPNVLTYEAVLNQEYNKWQPTGVRGTPPAHNLDIAFIRMLAGPLDYHQGGMRSVLPEDYRFRDKAPPGPGDPRAPAGDVRRLPEPPADDGRLPVRLSRPARPGVPRRRSRRPGTRPGCCTPSSAGAS